MAGKTRLFIFWLAALSASAPGQDAFSAGEDLFVRNRPADAISYLESAIKADPAKEKAYLYLGVAYLQVGKPDEAISVLKRGAAKAQAYAYLFSYDLGNCYFSQGKNAFAEDMYGQALTDRPDYAPAFLNRANTRMNLKRYADAVADYAAYLKLAPDSPQRESIERVMALINGSLAEADRALAEQARLKAEEEARRARLLSDVTDSLKQAAEETMSLSAGAEGSQGYDSESELAE
jgi:tetratricopeptide (TPR) repeat protein